MDLVDKRIVVALAANARLSLKALAEKVGMASPSVAERLKRLEERGLIQGYTIVVAPTLAGYPFQAIIRINPLPGETKAVERLIQDTPQIVECDRVTGEDCFHARLYCLSIDDLDIVLEPFHTIARTNTAIVKGQSVRRRLPPLRGE